MNYESYQRKPYRVDARQWAPPEGWMDTLKPDVDAYGNKFMTHDEGHGILVVRGRRLPIKAGDWIVVRDGRVQVMTDEAFQWRYEKYVKGGK